MNKSIELLFDIVKMRFDLSSNSILPSDFYSSRWVKGTADEEDWLAYSVIKSTIEITHEIRFAIIEYEANSYFIATGLESPDNIQHGINFFPINAGIFVALVTELELPVKSGITNLHLLQNVLSQNKSDPLYKGHELNDLLSIFPNIFIGEISVQYIGDHTNLQQLVCSYLASNKKYITLPFSEETLNKLNDLVLLNSEIINYDSIIQSLLSSQFKFSFLDLYRCLEMLFQIIYVDATYSKLSLSINKTDFLYAIDDKLNWRPNERNALKKLFAETPDQYKSEIIKAIKAINNQTKAYSDWLYDLRCSIVHLKSTQRNIILKPHQWDRLIFFLE